MLLFLLGAVLNFYINDVIVKRADSSITPTAGMEIRNIDTVVVKDSSQAEVLYSDSSTFYIGENSRVTTSGAEKRSIFISIGRVWAKIKKLIKGETFEIKSPLSVSGVIGTEFEVSYTNETAEIKVIEGKVNTKNIQTGREVILEKEKMSKIRKNMEMKVKRFKLQELKRWYKWKREHLEFLIRKIEVALRQERTIQAERLINQGFLLVKRLNLSWEYRNKFEELNLKYEKLHEQKELLKKVLNDINRSYNVFNLNLNKKEPKLIELNTTIQHLSSQTTELEKHLRKRNIGIIRQQLSTIDPQVKRIETLIERINPRELNEWQQKVDENCQLLERAQEKSVLDTEITNKIKVTAKRMKTLREKLHRLKTNLSKDILTLRKLKNKIAELRREVNSRLGNNRHLNNY